MATQCILDKMTDTSSGAHAGPMLDVFHGHSEPMHICEWHATYYLREGMAAHNKQLRGEVA